MRALHFVSWFLLLATSTLAQRDFIPTDGQIVIPPMSGASQDTDTSSTAKSKLMLSDVLTIQSSVSIFYSYARETHVGELLNKEDARITVFAPTNKAVMALARKPHQGPTPIDDGIIVSEEEFDARSRENVERWISAHVVPQHPIRLSATSQFEALLEGIIITISEDPTHNKPDSTEWERAVLNGNISVVSRVEAANGVAYLIDGAIYG